MMELIPEKNFEYSRLNDETKTIVRQRTLEIKNLMRLTAENIINIGYKLTEVKEKLGHGSFQNWLRSEFEWSEQTARQFMQVYRWSKTLENKNFVFSQLGTSALYLLAAPSTPSEAREEVLNLVEVGKKVNYTQAKDIIDRYKDISKSIEQESTEAVDLIDPELKPDDTSNQLFRLESSELGCIVRLYHANELEATAKLTVGLTVRIKVGRWQGKTATIIEVLTEQLSSMTDNQQINPTSAISSSEQRDVKVRALDEVDFSDPEKLREMSHDLIISYGDICLAVEGNSEILIAFVQQIKTEIAFVKNILTQALERHKGQA